MRILVKVENSLLGSSIFWEGESTDIDQIRNIPARRLAEIVSKRGGKRRLGMWRVSEVIPHPSSSS